MVMEAYAVTSKEPPARVRPPEALDPSRSRRDEFSAIVRDHDRQMRVLAYRLVGDAAAMDDVLQDAYLKAYRAYESFRGQSAVSTWLHRIVYNCCMDHLRKAGRDHLSSAASIHQLAERGIDVAGAERADAITLRDELESALATLPAEQRAAVVLIDALGYDHRSAADILGVRRATVTTRLHRARMALRRTLSSGRKDAQ